MCAHAWGRGPTTAHSPEAHARPVARPEQLVVHGHYTCSLPDDLAVDHSLPKTRRGGKGVRTVRVEPAIGGSACSLWRHLTSPAMKPLSNNVSPPSSASTSCAPMLSEKAGMCSGGAINPFLTSEP